MAWTAVHLAVAPPYIVGRAASSQHLLTYGTNSADFRPKYNESNDWDKIT